MTTASAIVCPQSLSAKSQVVFASLSLSHTLSGACSEWSAAGKLQEA